MLACVHTGTQRQISASAAISAGSACRGLLAACSASPAAGRRRGGEDDLCSGRRHAAADWRRLQLIGSTCRNAAYCSTFSASIACARAAQLAPVSAHRAEG